MTSDLPADILAEVESVYADLERELDALAHTCRACGDCCDLVRHGFRLYMSSLEHAFLLARTGRTELPPPAGGRCGFQRDGRCTVHAARPLGCRTYFCDADGGHLAELHEQYLRRLKRIADRHALPWNYEQKYPQEQAPAGSR
jgi:Fe-S-cluster containining protein